MCRFPHCILKLHGVVSQDDYSIEISFCRLRSDLGQHQQTGALAHAGADIGTFAEAARSMMPHSRSTASAVVDVEPIDNRMKCFESRLEPVRKMLGTRLIVFSNASVASFPER